MLTNLPFAPTGFTVSPICRSQISKQGPVKHFGPDQELEALAYAESIVSPTWDQVSIDAHSDRPGTGTFAIAHCCYNLGHTFDWTDWRTWVDDKFKGGYPLASMSVPQSEAC